MEQRPSNRACGPCAACCKVFKVPEVGKTDGNWCKHRVAGRGCAIYPARPFACRAFACLWLNGKADDSDRPDILGVMMDVQDLQLSTREIGIFHFWEIEAGGLQKPRVIQIARAMLGQDCVVLYHGIEGASSFGTRVQVAPGFLSAAETQELIQKLSS